MDRAEEKRGRSQRVKERILLEVFAGTKVASGFSTTHAKHNRSMREPREPKETKYVFPSTPKQIYGLTTKYRPRAGLFAQPQRKGRPGVPGTSSKTSGRRVFEYSP